MKRGLKIFYISFGIGFIPAFICFILFLLGKGQYADTMGYTPIFLLFCIVVGLCVIGWKHIKKIVLRIIYLVRKDDRIHIILFLVLTFAVITVLVIWHQSLVPTNSNFGKILMLVMGIFILLFITFLFSWNSINKIKLLIKKDTKNLFQNIREHWAIWLTIAFFIIIINVWKIDFFTDVSSFFGKDYTMAEILKYAGAICGGILVIGTLYANNKRNYLTEKGQLDIRFKDAALLLNSDNTKSILAGIYAFHQVAIDASKGGYQQGYIETIKKILCSVIRESKKKVNTNTYTEKDELDLYENSQQVIVLQAIIDALFRGDESKIYADFGSDLSGSLLRGCNLYGVNFSNANLIGADLTGTNLSEANLSNAFLDDANLSKAFMKFANLSKTFLRNAKMVETEFIRTNLSNAKLARADLSNARMSIVKLSKAFLENKDLNGTNFSEVDFFDCDLKYTDFSKAIFGDYSFSKCNFHSTIHEGKTIDEIKDYKPLASFE